MRSNVLSDPLFSVVIASETRRLPLPALYAALMADVVDDMMGVRPHQRQAVHAFLAQVGALGLLAAGTSEAPTDEASWEVLLRGLTPAFPGDEPWTLVVEDLSRPALLQPPVPEGTLKPLKGREETPDALDMLVTSRNHDVKMHRMARATPEHWLLALLTLQTLEGFLGAGNYGISRMNGGFASRPMVGLATRGGVGARIRRDIERLVSDRDSILKANLDYPARGGIGLVWLEPWDGTTPIQPKRLDPYYVEICRRVRLVEEGGRIAARRGSSKAARIALPKVANGVTGDPWTPIDRRKDGKALTMDGSGFHYRRVADLLDAKLYEAPPLQKWHSSDGKNGNSLAMVVIVRGEGGTDGFHERSIAIPPGCVLIFGEHPDELAKIARERVDDAGKVRRGVLRTAIFVLLQNAPETSDLQNTACETKAEPFLSAFDRDVDRHFFDALFEELGAVDGTVAEKARKTWLLRLKDLAVRQFEAAVAGTPRSSIRRYQAEAAGRSALEATFRKRFPNAVEDKP